MINITYKTVAEKATKEFYKQVKCIYLARETHYIASYQRLIWSDEPENKMFDIELYFKIESKNFNIHSMNITGSLKFSLKQL